MRTGGFVNKGKAASAHVRFFIFEVATAVVLVIVRLTDMSGEIAVFLKDLHEGFLMSGHAAMVCPHVMVVRIKAVEEGGSRRHAQRAGGDGVGKAEAFCAKTVKVGGANNRMACSREAVGAHLVGHNDKDRRVVGRHVDVPSKNKPPAPS